MPVKRLAALGLLFTLATSAAFACKAKTPAPPQDFDATAADASTDAADEGDVGPSQPEAGTACIVYPDILKSSMAAVGGSGTGLAQDATVQQIIKLYGASIPQGGSGTGLCQDASLQALYLLIAAQVDGGGFVQMGGNVIGPSYDAQVVEVQNQFVAAGDAGGQTWVFNGTSWLPTLGASSETTAHTVVGGGNYNVLESDIVIRFDTTITDAGVPTANLPAPSFIGERHSAYWWAWNGQQLPPVVTTPGGNKMVPFSGQASSGAAGLVTSTSITTPGASITWMWDGTEWVMP